MEKPSDIWRDSCLGSSELLVRSSWSQVWEEDKTKQKQYEPTYPVFGLHMEWEGDDKKRRGRLAKKINKEKEWTDANLRAQWKQNNVHGVCNKSAPNQELWTENKTELWEMTAMETAELVWYGRKLSGLGGGCVGQMAGGGCERVSNRELQQDHQTHNNTYVLLHYEHCKANSVK